ncbi:GNAT family N-acetyltransferase [Vineibacter terrae]|uniref:GNAT family N-acetyltransferase n=1 Tax=Vineibacter terrae TaxID=2586908 RepID=A0A5C8PKK4_9HYPH|nr:GNAT family N-acetyltransferase [Vineibacter terrae]TXL73884.1 GNAT family N-acetyltransferase [Vineibacter terrae]
MDTVITARLILRPLIERDAPAYADIRYHPEVARWLPASAGGDPVDNAARTIAYFAQCWASDGHGPWGLFLKEGDEEGKLIGHGGLRVIPEFDGQTEILYALHPEAWGKGYATELGRVSLRYGFERRGLPSIFAITKPDNHASQAVMTRLGMTYRKRVTYKDIDAVWFEIERGGPEPGRSAAL